MEIINITSKEFENLKPLDDVYSLESELYFFDNNTIMKRLYEEYQEEFNNKIYTIKELYNNKDIININELLIPKSLVKVKDGIIGFTIPYINGSTLEGILKSNKYTIKQKIEYLKQIGNILEQMKQVRKNTDIKDFYLNDIHEANFILNKQTNKINVLDLDSCKINDNKAGCAKYLTPLSKIEMFSKYKRCIQHLGGYYEICENTELYCYTIMIMNYIFEQDISRFTIEQYYICLEYLKKIGISKELVDKLSYIYSNTDNENIYLYLDELGFYKEKYKIKQ